MAFVVAALSAGLAAPTSAQSTNPADNTRAGVKGWYRDGRVDLEAAVDSSLALNSLRLRGSVGNGRWEGINAEPRPGGHYPSVTTLAASLILTRAFYDEFRGRTDEHVRWFLGAGIAAYVPHSSGMRTQGGVRLLLGMDISGRRWSVGPEIDVDLPRGHAADGRFADGDLFPTIRAGISIRRAF